MNKEYISITPAGPLDVSLEKAIEMKNLYGFPYRRKTKDDKDEWCKRGK